VLASSGNCEPLEAPDSAKLLQKAMVAQLLASCHSMKILHQAFALAQVRPWSSSMALSCVPYIQTHYLLGYLPAADLASFLGQKLQRAAGSRLQCQLAVFLAAIAFLASACSCWSHHTIF
jgi:hypothetical protein